MTRHATDRKETTYHSACPNGCDFGIECETEGKEESVDELIATLEDAFDECPNCGAELGSIRQDEPTEVLE